MEPSVCTSAPGWKYSCESCYCGPNGALLVKSDRHLSPSHKLLVCRNSLWPFAPVTDCDGNIRPFRLHMLLPLLHRIALVACTWSVTGSNVPLRSSPNISGHTNTIKPTQLNFHPVMSINQVPASAVILAGTSLRSGFVWRVKLHDEVEGSDELVWYWSSQKSLAILATF